MFFAEYEQRISSLASVRICIANDLSQYLTICFSNKTIASEINMNQLEEENLLLKLVKQAALVAAATELAVSRPVGASDKTITEILLAANIESHKMLAMAQVIAISTNHELLLMQQVLNSIAEGLLITDAERRITYMNDAFEEITGYAKADLVGGSCAVLQGKGTNQQTVNELKAALSAGQPFHAEILNYRKDGIPFWNDLSIIPVRDSEHKLTQFIGVQRDVTELKSAADKVEHLVFFDNLTGLPNRLLLLDRLNHAFNSSLRSGREGAVLFIDLDKLNDVNDTLGHNIGDMLIQQIAKRLESCMRVEDTISRLADGEFVVVLEALSEQRIEATKQVSIIGEKILDLLNTVYQLDTHQYHGTCSVGAVLFTDHKHTAEELLKRADIALFRSKNIGRKTMTFFNSEMQNVLHKRLAIERDIRIALEQQQLVLYYQIQVDSAHRTLGAEALLRWLHPERGLLSPSQFISTAEEVGLVLPIGQWVLETACSQLKAWEKNELTCELVLSVNVSAIEFRQVDFVDKIKALLKRYAINPRLLKLELTESMLLESIEGTIILMNELNKIGINFSLDDFGTGYSSLQYLKRLPIDQIKIDKSFIDNIVIDAKDKVIVGNIVTMAQSLDIKVIAEGIETEEQRKILLDIGCTQYQGYLFGKPMPIEQFEELLQEG